MSPPLARHAPPPILIHIGAIVGSDVCSDLVLYDLPQHNPFRDLIPLTHGHPMLLHIIVANSALHMSNACQKPLLLASPDMASVLNPPTEAYRDALAAKQRALLLLRTALASMASVDVDITLAVVLLFIEFELIDSGRDDWRHHIHGARTIIERLCGSAASPPTAMSPLRRCLISNCLMYDSSLDFCRI